MPCEWGKGVDVDFRLARLGRGTHVKPSVFIVEGVVKSEKVGNQYIWSTRLGGDSPEKKITSINL